MFTVKDVIRIARKADYSASTPLLALELARVCFTLIANAYGQVWLNSTNQLVSLWELFDAIRAFLGGLGNFLIYFGVEILDEFVKWILVNFNLIRPPRK